MALSSSAHVSLDDFSASSDTTYSSSLSSINFFVGEKRRGGTTRTPKLLMQEVESTPPREIFSRNNHNLSTPPSVFSAQTTNIATNQNNLANTTMLNDEESKATLGDTLLAPLATGNEQGIRERDARDQYQHADRQPLLANQSHSPTVYTNATAPAIKYKQYPLPQYRWDPGTFRRGPMGLCVCPSDSYRSIFLAILSIIPGAVFLAGVRASTDIESFVIVPFLTMCIIFCLLFATTCDPGIYRKRYISPSDMARVKRQQIRRENELRKKRNLPLIPTDSEGNYLNSEAPQHATVPIPSNEGNEMSDEDHPNRLNFERKVYVGVGGPNNDQYQIECGMCTACGILKRPRVGHCFHCNVCVDEFDHHCGVLGSCVGKRNFRFFAGFLYGATFLSLYIGIRVVIVLSTDIHWGTVWESAAGQFRIVASVLLIMGAGCGACFTCPMMMYYIQLAAINSTQKQEGNYHSKVGEGSYVANPYRTNVFRDYWTRMCGPLGASRADRHGREGELHTTADR